MLNKEDIDKFFASPKSGDRAMEMIVRMSSVKRWHMVDTTRTQTLAEHSMNVALLAWYIARTCPEGYFMSPDRAAVVGLLHDIEESVTGDIQSITKHFLWPMIQDIESDLIPGSLQTECDGDIASLVKICDLADGIRFIRVYGNNVATKEFAKNGLELKLRDQYHQVTGVWPDSVIRHVQQKITLYIYE